MNQMNIPENKKEKAAKIIAEQKEKRNANTKYFLTENHGGVAAIYPYPVHYEEDGEWKDIDNGLQEENSQEEGYENKAARFKVKFAKYADAKKLVSVKLGEHKLSWGLEQETMAEEAEASAETGEEADSSKKPVFRVYAPEEASGDDKDAMDTDTEKEDVGAWNQRQIKVKHAKSGGIYEEVRKGMDIQYILEGERLKENIILKDLDAAKIPVRFRIRHKGLLAEQQEQGGIRFCEEKNPEKEVCRMAVPYMYDGAGTCSDQVTCRMETVKEGEMILTIIPDGEWLLSSERQFPVIVDPGLETSHTVSNIMETYVRENYPNSSAAGSHGSFFVGRNSESGRCRALLKFNTLPAIPEGAVVYDASVCIWQYGFSANDGNGFYVEAHEVKADETGEWHSATTTWNTQPAYESEVLDFAKMENVVSGNTVSIVPKQFHVTKLIRKWYAGKNYGILLKKQNESIYADAQFVASDYPVGDGTGITADLFPSGTICYRDSVGVEDYFSYHDQTVGRAGTVHVNDFNGNMVLIHPDTQISGNLFPASLAHVYNLAKRKVDKGMGLGWRLSAHQELLETGISDYPYRYIDGDGTSHYFYKDTTDNNKLKDEDGLGLVITQTSSGNTEAYRKIETKGKVTLTFHKDGYLVKETDPNGNTITYIYSTENGKNRLTQIQNAVNGSETSGKVLILQYKTDGRLSNIIDEAGRSITFNYEGTNLKSITYPDGKSSLYGYDVGSRVNVLKYVKAPDEYEMEYDFVEDCGTVRVSGIKEKKGSATGQEIKITYKDGNMTVFEEPGLDGQLSGVTESSENAALDNRIYTYQFDNSGRPVCVCDQDGNAASYGYFKEGQKNNKLSSQGSTMKTVNNHLLNTRFEDNFNYWNIYSQDTTQVSIAENIGYIGAKSAKVARTATGEGASGVHQLVDLEPGTYTVSAYMKVDEVSGGYMAIAVLGVRESGGSETLCFSPGIHEATDPEIDGGWRRESITFTLGSIYKKASIIGAIFNGSGTGYMTCFQLEEGNTANTFNILENGSFERVDSASSTVPSTFTGILTDNSAWADGRIATDAKYGDHALRIYGEPGKRKGFWKRIPLQGKETDVFSVSGWARGKGVPGREFGMTVGFEYTDNTYKWENIAFNPSVTDWQFVSQTISPNDQIGDTGKKYQAILFHIFYGDNANDAYFDGIQLIRDDGESYVYDDDGNLISAKSAAEKAGFAHDKNGNLSKMSDITGTSFEYGYDTNQNLKRAASSEQVVYQFEYDDKGNPVRTLAYGDKRRGAVMSERIYYIRETVSGKYLTVPNSSSTNGTAVQLKAFTGSSSQKWKVVDMGGGYFSFLPMHNTGLALDVHNGSDADGTKVEIYTRNNKDAQKFKLLAQWRGDYQIAAKCSKDKRVLTNAANTTSEGALITTWAANDSYDRQKWYFEPADLPAISDEPEDGSIFAIRARHSGQYLDVKRENMETGAGDVLQQYYSNGGENQSFFLKKETGTDNYFLRPLCTPDMALTRIANDTSLNRPAVVLQAYSGTNAAQKFQFVKVGDYYAIVNPQSGEGMGVVGGAENSVGSGARVVTNGGTVSAYADNKLFLLENRGKQIASSMTYTSGGRQVASVTDARGNTTTNTYDSLGRLLKKVTDAKGNETEYTYEASTDRLTKVSTSVNGTKVSNTYTYDGGDRLSSIGHNGMTYSFEYDNFGNKTKVKVGDTALATYEYLPHNGPQKSMTYANGVTLTNEYDKDFRLTSRTCTDASGNQKVLCENTYDAYDRLLSHKDVQCDVTYDYRYDLISRLTAMDTSEGQKLRIAYDDKNRPKWTISQINGSTKEVGYIYGNATDGQKPGLIYGMMVDGYQKSHLSYDQMSRLTEKKIALGTGNNYYTNYTYVKGAKDWQTTTLPESIKNGSNTLKYTYDELGNITKIHENGSLKATYTYDGLSRLIREDNKWLNKTICYSYDAGGNITAKKEYTYTTGTLGTAQKTVPYGYGNSQWKDQMTSYNGQTISYDALGNPRIYRDGMTMQWERGRNLSSLGNDANGRTYIFTYNSDGMRVRKEVVYGHDVEKTVKYYWNGNQIAAIQDGTNLLHFTHDQDGNLFSVILGDKTYYYLHNIQKDVIGLIDSTGNQVVSYRYDTWGNPMSMTDTSGTGIGTLNPFRYREYCYDEETGLYYLGSRYYDPVVGRFVNADDPALLLSGSVGAIDKNLYAYCDNNPINRIDDGGEYWNIVAGAVIGGAISVGMELANQVISSKIAGEKVNWTEAGKAIAISAVSGAIGGGMTAAGVPVNIERAVTGAISGLTEAYTQFKNKTELGEGIVDVLTTVGMEVFFAGRGNKPTGASYKELMSQNKIIRYKLKNNQYKTIQRGEKELRRNLKRLKQTKIAVTKAGIKSTFWGTTRSTVWGYRKKACRWLKEKW